MTARTFLLAWANDPPEGGIDCAEATLDDDHLYASGVAIRPWPQLYRLDYELRTTNAFITDRLVVNVRGQGWRRSLVLSRNESGTWNATTHAEGSAHVPELSDTLSGLDRALDCDLALCPLTNTMPVLRSGLLNRDGAADFVMAWVSVPDLNVHASSQRYVSRAGRIRYESADRSFTADLTFDENGFVVHYQGLARSLNSDRR